MDKKKILKRFFKLRLRPGFAAFDDQEIGPNLSPFLMRDKINLFCTDFNNMSKIFFNEVALSVIFYLNTDNSFFFIIKGPRFSELLKLIININSLSLNLEHSIFLTEFFDLICYKYFFFFNNFKFNNFLLKKFLINNLFSIKNINLENNSFFENDITKT